MTIVYMQIFFALNIRQLLMTFLKFEIEDILKICEKELMDIYPSIIWCPL